MSTLAEMSVTDAASKALEIILSGSHAKYAYRKDTSWREYHEIEEGQNLDDDHWWQEVKYEGGTEPYTVDGLTAKVEAEHGGEGQGDQYWVVISLSDGEDTRYFRRDGWYASYDGGYLDGPTNEVSPQPRTVIFYE